MNLSKTLSAAIVLSTVTLAQAIFAQDGADLLKKMDHIIFAPKDKVAQVKIITYNNGKEDKVREAELKQKGPILKIYKYTAPESQAGIATLSLPGDIMWMKMPALDKPKKISLLAKSQAFSGTDFAWEDIPVQPYSDRYVPKFLKADGAVYLVELTPNSDKSSYSKLIVAIDKTYYYPVKMEYYDKGGSKVKEAAYVYKKVGNYWNANEVTMSDLKKKTSTTITMSDVKFDTGLPDDIFTEDKFWR
jgi:outer membrane lipoprotein-sorting protein